MLDSLLKQCLVVAIFCSFFISMSCSSNGTKKNTADVKQEHSDIKQEYTPEYIGEKFYLHNIIDSAGNAIVLDFKKSKITIIDIWINDCPPCNEEMSMFKDLITGKEKDVSIVSISASGYPYWKALFNDSKGRYEFLKHPLPNWKHYVLKTETDPKLNNVHSIDRIEDLEKTLGVNFFPAFFVLNTDGIIIARPISAVQYLKENL